MDNKTAEWYQYIDDLVAKYQQGDSESGLLILNAFEPYMKKYGRIIKDGHIDLRDKDSRKFISLFIQEREIRQGLKKHYQSREIRNATYKTAAMLAKICESISIDDIKQDFYVILLSLCKRYVKKGKRTNFCGYVYNVFRYEVHRRITEITKDPITYRSDINISFNETQYVTPNEEHLIDQRAFDGIPVVIQDDELGNSWIRGITCDDVFLLLTPLQRVILKKYYIDGFSDPAIADQLCMHKNTIYRNRQKAEDVVAEIMGENFVQVLQDKRNIKYNNKDC